VAKQILHDCRAAKLPLFLELVTYPLPNFNSNKPELVLDSVYNFLQAGIIPDVFKLEYPGDPAACFQITKLLKKTPWILLTKGDSFANFRKQLKVVVENGAVGFLAGRSLWQEFSQYPESKRQDFFQTVVVQRFSQIRQIVLSS
jgi:tagatose 1,6-diphosphate aldolase